MSRDPERARRAAAHPDRPGELCKAPPGTWRPQIDHARCEAKHDCVDVCPYDVFEVRRIDDADYRALSWLARLKVLAHRKQTAYTPRADACQACGLCVVSCPEGAITLMRSMLTVAVLACLMLAASAVHAATFNVALTSGEGQFAGKDAAAFGQSLDPTDVELTADEPATIGVQQFSGFFTTAVFPYEPGASTTFTQTLTVNGVSTSVVRTITLALSGDGCTLVQSLSPVVLTVDLGTAGKVTLDLQTPPTLGFPCTNGQPSPGILVIIPGTLRPIAATVLDDFLTYKTKLGKGAAKLLPFGALTLADGLGGGDYDVVGLDALGLPAGPNGSGTFDALTHLASYRLKRRKASGKFLKVPDVPIDTPCGKLLVTAQKPESLLVPVNESEGSPPVTVDPQVSLVDHFLCYKAKTQKKRSDGTPVAVLPKKMQIEASDHFQTRRYDVKKVTRLCLPVDKSGSPVELKSGAPVTISPAAIRHPASELVCYQVKPAKSTIAQTACGPADAKDKGTKIVPAQAKHQKRLGVLVNGQLGAATLDTSKEQELCVPVLAEQS